MHLIMEYCLFIAKTLTTVIAILLTVAGITAICGRNHDKNKQKFSIKKINQKLNNINLSLMKHVASKSELKQYLKDEKNKCKQEKKQAKENPKHNKSKIFVLDFNGDIRASAVTQLREEITAILTIATPKDEVFIRLESGGGMVHTYGLAASQLQRIRQKQIPLTVSVDRVAASGGYLMAAVANRILAAPFAIIGSIGVLAQIPNFSRLLKKHHVDFEQLSAGEYKRTLSLFGQNTSKGRKKMQEHLEEIHQLFKIFLAENRPMLNLEEIATGEHWLAKRAHELKLVDDLITSDDYLVSMSNNHDIYEIKQHSKKSKLERLSHAVQQSYHNWLHNSLN